MNCKQTESVIEKAERLKATSRVIIIRKELALVIGDSDTYKVTKHGDQWSCDCKWGRYRGAWRDCSHVVAVKRARIDPASQVAVSRLADILMEANVG